MKEEKTELQKALKFLKSSEKFNLAFIERRVGLTKGVLSKLINNLQRSLNEEKTKKLIKVLEKEYFYNQ